MIYKGKGEKFMYYIMKKIKRNLLKNKIYYIYTLFFTIIFILVYWVFYKNRISIRKRVFIKIRRLFLRLRRRKFISLSLARRAVSYFGFIKHTNSFILYQKYKISALIKSCKGVISYASRISIHSTPT